ncbi:unnamed protein product [Rotaria magnacalcarata]
MVDYHQSDPFVMSSGTIDPEFLIQCQIADPKFQNSVDALKSIPLKFETPSTYFSNQEDIFLDMGAPNANDFYDPWQFNEYNSWLGSSDQWDSTYDVNNDLVIELI